MVLNIKFTFCEYNKLRKNHEFEKNMVFMLRTIQKASEEMQLNFVKKKMLTIKD
jgi:hypothetical protein